MIITIENASEEALDFLESRVEEALMDGKEVNEDLVDEIFEDFTKNYARTED